MEQCFPPPIEAIMDPQLNGELVPQGGGDNIPLTRTPLVLGRRESCDICLHFPNISGKHCELFFKDGFWILHDLESKNGVKINGIRVDSGARKVLHNGDELSIAKRSFIVQYAETGRASDLDEYEEEIEDIMNMPLLEKANLMHPPRHPKKPKADAPAPPEAEEE
jgi:pSer/pThr/pTyr-binding forkhead associated (FHA) protein